MTAPATTLPAGMVPYLSDRFEWAAPGDQQHDAWLVRFCDQDCGDAIFVGPDAEREAWEYWNRYAPGFNIYVFRLARLAATRPAAATDAERKAIARCIEIVRETRDGFLSEQYATDQPLSSFHERFACDQCADMIEREFGMGTIEQRRLLGKPTPGEEYRAALAASTKGEG